jgi:uncharacterized protein YqhQ
MNPKAQTVDHDTPPIPVATSQTYELHTLTLLGVHVNIECVATQNGVDQTLILTKIPSGDQIKVPMDAVSAAQIRKQWDDELAKARGREEATA